MVDDVGLRWPSGQPSDPFAQGPTTGETIGAAFRQQNPIASAIDAIHGMPGMGFDPNHNPRDTLRGTPHENDDFSIYAGSPNEGYTRYLMARKEREDSDRQTLAASGNAGLVAQMAAGTLDPLLFVPVFGEARGALKLATVGAGLAATQEATLQASQVARPWQESAGNVASAAILSGVLGAALNHLSPAEQATATSALDETRPKVGAPPRSTPELGSSLAGAAVTDTRELQPVSVLGLQNIPGFTKLSPGARIFFGDNPVTKRTAKDLVETAYRFEPDEQVAPFGAPLESIARVLKNSSMATTRDIIQSNWYDHYYGTQAPGVKGALGIEGIGAPSVAGKFSYRDFSSELYRALGNADVHEIPQVQTAAQQIRTSVINPLTEMGQKVEGPDGQPMLSDEMGPPRGAKSFVPLQPNRDAINANYAQTSEFFTDKLEQEYAIKAAIQERLAPLVARQKELAEKVGLTGEAADELSFRNAQLRAAIENEVMAWHGKSSKEAQTAIGKGAPNADRVVDESVQQILKTPTDLSRQELKSIANQWIDRWTGTPDGRLPYDMADGGPRIGWTGGPGQQVRGSLRERKMWIPVNELQDRGLIQTDVEHVINNMLRTYIPDVLLTDRFGDVNMTDRLRKIRESYESRLTPDMSEAQQSKIIKQRDADLRDVAAMRDRFRGVYGWDPNALKSGAFLRDFQNLNVLTSLGTSVINRAIDMGANATFRYGFTNVLRDIWAPLFKALVTADPTVLKASKAQAKEMGIGVDGLLGHLRTNLYDVTNAYEPGNKFSRGLAWAADKSMLVNLHGPWTDWWKAVSWYAAQGEYGRTAARIANGTGTKADLARMADASIDTAMAKRISNQYEQFHTVIGKSKFANTPDWTDQGARTAFEAAMSREANINVLTPGIGDKPLVMSNQLGRTILQFKSFLAAAHEKLLVANIQKRDSQVLQGLITAMGMGMLSYWSWSHAAGAPVSENPGDWIKEAIHRSAITAWLGEGNQIASKFTGGMIDYSRLFGATQPLTRRAETSPLADLLGPAAGKAEGLIKASSDILTGHASGYDLHQIRVGAMPLQNEMFIRRLFDELEDGTAHAFGLSPRKRQTPSP